MAAKAKKAGKRTAAARKATSARSPATGTKKAAKKSSREKTASRSTVSRSAASRSASVAETSAKPARRAPPAKSPAAAKPKPVAKKSVPASVADVGGLGAGAMAPSFELLDQSGASISSETLRGQPYVIYFYPKDDTPGCTTEACGFRDALPEFDELGTRVLGVSPDATTSHQKFAAKYELPFTLLSDDDKTLASAYGVWALKKNYGREYMGVVRSTFLVGADGIIKRVWRGVRVNGHVAEVRSEAEKLAAN
jgi:peroxiredoxin Q/BCP